jgi:RNA polymerase sigma-70 factor (ECF subfamily)
MDRGLKTVETAFEKSGKSLHFETFKPWLVGEVSSLSQADAASILNITPGAVKVSIHRLRKDFADAIRSEIAQTVNTPGEISEELRYLIEVLSKPRPN